MLERRSPWLSRMDQVARPVLEALSRRELKQRMPVEHHPASNDRKHFTYLEALARTMCGIAPWLELDGGQLTGDEQTLHRAYRHLAAEAVAGIVDRESPDYGNFAHEHQPIVDAAFLAHAAIRAPQLFRSLDANTLEQLVEALKLTRTRKPYPNNWLLFSGMIEAALHQFTGECDLMRIDYAVRQHEQWYKGGGIYGDGKDYHADFYNSFVIQPMLIDILRTMKHLDGAWDAMFEPVMQRAKRYAEIQERTIMPDGSFPPIGRSIAYRCGAFQHLAQMALQHALPATITPGQCRCALFSTISRTLDAPGTFDDAGWLRIGLCGHQPSLGEVYISTGSLYLCASVFLPLGLPATDVFWRDDDAVFSSQRAWSGTDLPTDKG
jgi:hypothetical protein